MKNHQTQVPPIRKKTKSRRKQRITAKKIKQRSKKTKVETNRPGVTALKIRRSSTYDPSSQKWKSTLWKRALNATQRICPRSSTITSSCLLRRRSLLMTGSQTASLSKNDRPRRRKKMMYRLCRSLQHTKSSRTWKVSDFRHF